MEKRKKRMKKREKEGLGFPEFSGTYFRELISRPEFREGFKIVLVLDLENGNGKIKVFSTYAIGSWHFIKIWKSDKLDFWRSDPFQIFDHLLDFRCSFLDFQRSDFRRSDPFPFR